MLDLDPRLETRLRSFYEHIEQQSPPGDIAAVEAKLVRRRRRTFPLLAGVAGVAVVAAGVGLFVTELSGHHAVKPPAPAAHSPGQRASLPSASQLTLAIPSISHTVIGVTHGHGTETLPTFTPQGMIFIELSCAGSTGFNLYSPNHAVGLSGGCDGSPSPSLAGVVVPAYAAVTGRPLTLTMTADPSTMWEIVVADGGPVPPLPTFGRSSLPAGAHVLVPATYGVGTTQVETFVPSGPYFVEYACAGSGTINFTTFDGPANWVSAECAHGAVGIQESAKPASGPINFTVETTPPRTLWEVVIFEVPAPKS
jgi:hypothetical protein